MEPGDIPDEKHVRTSSSGPGLLMHTGYEITTYVVCHLDEAEPGEIPQSPDRSGILGNST